MLLDKKSRSAAARLSLVFFLLQSPVFLFAQEIRGKVIDKQGNPLRAEIKNLIDSTLAISNNQGEFSFFIKGNKPKSLYAISKGYKNDTLEYNAGKNLLFNLEAVRDLPGVEVQAKANDAFLQSEAVIKTEVIGRPELKKAACCDLAGCFETQGTVQPQVTNIVSNSKELRILGLSGVYNQVLVDGLPMIQGLSYTYGISGIPGPLIENIFVSKGTNSVLQGFEGISGQINVITTNPEKADRLRTSLYFNNFREAHINAAWTKKSENHSFTVGIHGISPATNRDRDGDGFLDVTKLSRNMGFLNGKWNNGRWNGEYGIRATEESRIGGQRNFDSKNPGSNTIYGQKIGFGQLDIRNRIGYELSDNKRILIMMAVQRHQQDSWYGCLHYTGNQDIGFANIQTELDWGKHTAKVGISLRFLNAEEKISFQNDPVGRTFGGAYQKKELIPGLFAENIFSFFNNKLKLITGLRADKHNQFGLKISPRAMIRWDLNESLILRANAGSAWRTINLFSENPNIMSGSRNLILEGNLKPESAVNAGVSLTKNLDFDFGSGYISGDAYATSFQNQIFPDFDSEPKTVLVKNFEGTSRSLYAQLEGKLNFNNGLSLRGSYSYTENYRLILGERKTLPFNPLHRGQVAISYRTKKQTWQFDLNHHIYGPQYLPDTRQNPEAYRTAEKSPAFQTLNLQVIRFMGRFEMYAGCENAFDFRQLKPITAWQEPFSPWFDTAGIWGPTRGRELYMGLRFTLP